MVTNKESNAIRIRVFLKLGFINYLTVHAPSKILPRGLRMVGVGRGGDGVGLSDWSEQIVLGSVPGKKYSCLPEQAGQANCPVVGQIAILRRSSGGVKPGEGYF